jgi:hypothetical protein
MASITVLPELGLKILANRFCIPQSNAFEPLRKKDVFLAGISRQNSLISVEPSTSGIFEFPFSASPQKREKIQRSFNSFIRHSLFRAILGTDHMVYQGLPEGEVKDEEKEMQDARCRMHDKSRRALVNSGQG